MTHRNGSFAPSPHPAPQAAHMDVELGGVDGVCPDTPEAAAPDDAGSKRWFTRGRRLPWGTRHARKPPPWAGDAAGDDASAHAAAGAEDLRTSSGDSAAFPSAGQKLLKLVMLVLLLASLAVGASLAYKTGARDAADMRCAALHARRSRKPSHVPDSAPARSAPQAMSPSGIPFSCSSRRRSSSCTQISSSGCTPKS